MPIRTYRNGAFVLAITALAVVVSVLAPADTAQAAKPASSTRKVAKTSATKGVRTKTAYQTRRSGVAKAKAASYSVALPTEASGASGSPDIVSRAMGAVGKPYRWGGTGKAGFDCSGLVLHVLGDKGNNLPHSSSALYHSVSKTTELQPGDLVFFGRGRISHTAVYIGNGKIVHASTPRTGVRVDSLNTIARALGYKGAGRI